MRTASGPSSDSMPYPLEGLRVLSLAEQYPGPYATLLLADLGADVIVVERPSGDPSRVFPEFYESLNRGKRAIALDLKTEGGRRAVERLVTSSDVFLEGFRPGTMQRLGLGYDTLAEINPRLVYVSISGFGQDGPYRDRAAHDVSYQALAGMLHERIPSADTGAPSELAIGDLSAGMFGVVGVLTALHARSRTGRGTYVDLAMTDGLVSWMTSQLFPALNDADGSAVLGEPGYGIFRCADGGLITLSVAHEDAFWARLCDAVGMDDVRDLGHAERLERRESLLQRIERAVATRHRDDWAETFAKLEVPFAPVHSLRDVPDDPQVRTRGTIVETPGDGRNPPRRHVRQPIRMRGFEDGPRRHCPVIGEHTREVLLEAGHTTDEVTELINRGDAVEMTSSAARDRRGRVSGADPQERQASSMRRPRG